MANSIYTPGQIANDYREFCDLSKCLDKCDEAIRSSGTAPLQPYAITEYRLQVRKSLIDQLSRLRSKLVPMLSNLFETQSCLTALDIPSEIKDFQIRIPVPPPSNTMIVCR